MKEPKTEAADVKAAASRVERAAARVAAAIAAADHAVREHPGFVPRVHSGVVGKFVLGRVAGRLGWGFPRPILPSLTAVIAAMGNEPHRHAVQVDGGMPPGDAGVEAQRCRAAIAAEVRGRRAAAERSAPARAVAALDTARAIEQAVDELLVALADCDAAVRKHPRYDPARSRHGGAVVRHVRHRLAPALGGGLSAEKGAGQGSLVEALSDLEVMV